MSKYCPECKVRNPDEARFCSSCCARLDVTNKQNNTSFQQVYNKDMMPQYYNSDQAYSVSKKPSSKYKLYTIISVIGVVSIIIGALIYTGYFNSEGDSKPYINKIHVKGGPKVNIESIVTGGNALATPDEGYTAVYGYYMGSSKVGDISFTSVGEQSYGGNQCNKITGDGNFYFEIYGQSMEANFDIDAYISQSDGILTYCEYSFEFCNPFSMDMDMILDIDKDKGEITVTVDSSLIDSQSTVIKTPDEYWECTILRDNLYVGYSKEVTYAMDVLGIDTEVSLKISVIGIEDVTVKKGTFEDCYIIQIDQEQAYSTSTSTIWVDEDGICPKMQIGSSGTTSMSYEGMTIELEEYYITG